MQTLELNKMGLAPMTEFEMQEMDGGTNWWYVGAIVFGVAAILCTGGAAAPGVAVATAEILSGAGEAAAGASMACTALGS